MSLTEFTTNELAAALTRGVRQCVVMGMRPHLPEPWQIFSVDALTYETLPDALKQSTFDTAKAALFLWLGGAGFRTIDAMLLSLRFIASLPKGSALLFDYSVERASLGGLTQSALDALTSKLTLASGRAKYCSSHKRS